MTQNSMTGVQLALLTARFEGIARKMANTLQRTGRSGILTIARDFSCVILTAKHELLTASDSLPIHVLRGPEVMARTMTDNHPALRRGDAFLHNSPYHGCTHPADHSILVPVIDDDGVHRFTVLAKATRPTAATPCRRPTWARRRTSMPRAR
jgi:N-methylhydantoinase B